MSRRYSVWIDDRNYGGDYLKLLENMKYDVRRWSFCMYDEIEFVFKSLEEAEKGKDAIIDICPNASVMPTQCDECAKYMKKCKHT